MAKQSGIIPIEGTIGNLTFLKTARGYQVRTKGGVSRQRIMSDPAYVRTRENLREFGTAAKGAKLVRSAFHSEVRNAPDGQLQPRLLQKLHQALKTDTTNPRGYRQLADADISGLLGFEFNSRSTREGIFTGEVPVTIDREAGTATLTLAPFTPNHALRAPQGATHFGIVLAAAEIDFALGASASSRSQTAPQALGNTEVTLPPFVCAIPEDGTLPVLAVIGILFFQEINSEVLPLNNGAFNALSVVMVDM